MPWLGERVSCDSRKHRVEVSTDAAVALWPQPEHRRLTKRSWLIYPWTSFVPLAAMGPAAHRHGIVPTAAARHISLPLRRCHIRRVASCILPQLIYFHGKAITIVSEQGVRVTCLDKGRVNTIAISSTRICQDCALMKSKLSLVSVSMWLLRNVLN